MYINITSNRCSPKTLFKYVCVYTYKMFTRLLKLNYPGPFPFNKGLSSLINRLVSCSVYISLGFDSPS